MEDSLTRFVAQAAGALDFEGVRQVVCVERDDQGRAWIATGTCMVAEWPSASR